MNCTSEIYMLQKAISLSLNHQ